MGFENGYGVNIKVVGVGGGGNNAVIFHKSPRGNTFSYSTIWLYHTIQPLSMEIFYEYMDKFLTFARFRAIIEKTLHLAYEG